MVHSGTVVSDIHVLLSFSQLNGMDTIIIPILQPRKLRVRERVSHPKSHIAEINRLGIKSKQPDIKAEP